MSWYTEEEIEKLLEDEELRKRIARFVTMSGEEFFDEVYTHLSPEELEEYLEENRNGFVTKRSENSSTIILVLYSTDLQNETETIISRIREIVRAGSAILSKNPEMEGIASFFTMPVREAANPMSTSNRNPHILGRTAII